MRRLLFWSAAGLLAYTYVLFPLLVLHLVEAEPAYGNRLIEEIERITEGVISVNPNTIYPLLRDLLGIVPVALGIYLVTRHAAAPGSR